MKKNFIICTIAVLFVSTAYANSLQNSSAIKHFPKDTQFIIAANNPHDLLDHLGLQEIVQKNQKPYQQIAKEMKREIGFNLFDVEDLKKSGIDPSQPFGLVVFDFERQLLAFFGGVSDRKAFKTTMIALTQKHNKSYTATNVGDAILLSDANADKEVSILIFADCFIFVVADHYKHRIAPQYTAEMAKRKSEDSLANNPSFTNALNHLNFGKDAILHLNMTSIIDMAIKDLQNPPNNTYLKEQQLELAKLQKENPDSPEIDNIKRNIAEEQRWLTRRVALNRCREVFMTTVFKPLRSITVGGELQQKSLQVKAHLDIARNALGARLLKNKNNSLKLLQILEKQPLFLADARLDFLAIRELIALFIPTENLNFNIDMAEQGLEKELGINLHKDIGSLLGGEIGIAVTGDLTLDDIVNLETKDEEMAQKIDIVSVIEVKDETQANDLLKRIASHPAFGEMLQPNDDIKGYSVPLPIGKSIHIGVTSGHILITSNSELFKKTETTSFVNSHSDKDIQKILTTANMNAALFIDMMVFGIILPRARNMRSEPGSPGNVSEEYKKKQQELRRLEEERDALSEAHQKSELELIARILKRLGVTVAAGSYNNGINIHSGQFVDEDTKTFLSSMFNDLATQEEKEKQYYAKSDEYWQKIDKVRKELEEIRQHDEESLLKEDGDKK